MYITANRPLKIPAKCLFICCHINICTFLFIYIPLIHYSIQTKRYKISLLYLLITSVPHAIFLKLYYIQFSLFVNFFKPISLNLASTVIGWAKLKTKIRGSKIDICVNVFLTSKRLQIKSYEKCRQF